MNWQRFHQQKRIEMKTEQCECGLKYKCKFSWKSFCLNGYQYVSIANSVEFFIFGELSIRPRSLMHPVNMVLFCHRVA